MRPKGLSTMLVRGLCGPGLPKQRFYYQRHVYSDLQRDEEDSAERGGTEAGLILMFDTEYCGEDEQIGMIREEWSCRETTSKVTLTVRVGSYRFAVYCRKGRSSDSDEEDHSRPKATASSARDSVNKKCPISLTCTAAWRSFSTGTLSRVEELSERRAVRTASGVF